MRHIIKTFFLEHENVLKALLALIFLLCLLVLAACSGQDVSFEPYDYKNSSPAKVKTKKGYQLEIDGGLQLNKKTPFTLGNNEEESCPP